MSMASPDSENKGPEVLVLVGAYVPGYKGGGPIRSIENLVAALGDEVRFRILTSDRDLGDSEPYPGIVANEWVRVGHADVKYLTPGLRGYGLMWELMRSADQNTVVYLNGYFARLYAMLPILMRWLKLSRPRCVVLAPRGEFSPGALHIKPWRKRFFISATRWLGVYRNLVWHASTDLEAKDILRQFPEANAVDVAGVLPATSKAGDKRSSMVVTASDLARGSDRTLSRGLKAAGKLRVVFVSRISRKKNLAGAIGMLANLSGEVIFEIYGPEEDGGYWHECLELIAKLPPTVSVQYRGQVSHNEIGNIFTKADLFLFPTHGENYGHVIYEALASGCLVLISDQTPWRDLEEEGVGWALPLADPKRFEAALQQCIDADDATYSKFTARATQYARRFLENPELVEANRRLFRRAMQWTEHAE
jgi:glycosyltransferase involved in cell wall biosynthesis